MAEFDIVVRNGTIVDGSGGLPAAGDVGIADGVIAAVGRVSGTGREEIDAAGRLVVPGFVDLHTHYDGQVTWDNRLSPSSEHGVTTVLMGNCGVGFAPCKPHEHAVLLKVMEGVEDIPEAVLAEGVPWRWETFPEYLNFLAARQFDVDCTAYLPHAALRVFVMGDRAVRREPSTLADRARMKLLVVEAIRAGAMGVSCSRLLSHRDADGNLAPHVQTDVEELLALAEGLREAGGGIFQIAAAFSNQNLTSVLPDQRTASPMEAARREVELLVRLCRASGRPLTFALSILNHLPEVAPEVLRLIGEANAEPGISIVPQVFPRPIGILFGLELSLNPFSFHPSYQAIESLPLAQRVAEMRRPELRARILSEEPARDGLDPVKYMLAVQSLDAYPSAGELDYEPAPGDSLRAIAAREGRTVEEAAYDALLENGGRALLFLPISNYPGSLDPLADMLSSEHTVVALGDGGAHLGLICDASYPTFLLSHWARDRSRGSGRLFDLPQAVNRLTRRNAMLVGLTDRGLIAPGMKADVNVIDFAGLHLHAPEVAFDLPAGGRRLFQRVDGIEATIVSGVITYRQGVPTGALPGRLVRRGQAAR
ncbi:MAG: amidohydrolase family protein [Novosphingobium sp.]